MSGRVLVIGGGMAGLATAVHLSAQGLAVTLLEAADRLGGRLAPEAGPDRPESAALHAALPDLPVIVFGWHDATHAFLRTLGTHDRLAPSAGRLEWHTPTRRARLGRCWAPRPFDAVLNLVTFRGLSGRDRVRLLSWLERTWEGDLPVAADLEMCTGDRWLGEIGQSLAARAEVWDPLSHVLTGQAVTDISAAVLSRALARTFLRGRRRAAWTYLAGSLQDALTDPASERLRRHGAEVRLRTGAQRMRFSPQGVTGVELTTGATLTADWYVLAVPHRAVTGLLPDDVLTHYAYFQHLTQLTDTPATVVHLHIATPLDQPRLCLLAARSFDWLLARPEDPDAPGTTRLSLVGHGRIELDRQSDDALVESASRDARFALPELDTAPMLHPAVHRRAAAWLHLPPGTAQLRPLAHGPFPNLLLAGDWTDTGLPPTLESALVSATRCADIIVPAARADPRR